MPRRRRRTWRRGLRLREAWAVGLSGSRPRLWEYRGKKVVELRDVGLAGSGHRGDLKGAGLISSGAQRRMRLNHFCPASSSGRKDDELTVSMRCQTMGARTRMGRWCWMLAGASVHEAVQACDYVRQRQRVCSRNAARARKPG